MSDLIKKQLDEYSQSKLDRKYDLTPYSHARLGLGHTGGHLKLKDWLDFQAGFAQAKDAVFSQFSVTKLKVLCDELNLPCLRIDSRVNDATLFLLRPDLGRLLSEQSMALLNEYQLQHNDTQHTDILIIISGGLSPMAIEHQMPTFFPLFINKIKKENWSLAPIMINPKGRVALGDQVNDYFKSKMVVMLIGERPGLTTPDSLGIYFTYQAKPGCTDEQRNCISNIHSQGLTPELAVEKLVFLLKKSLQAKISGFMLKDDLHPVLNRLP